MLWSLPKRMFGGILKFFQFTPFASFAIIQISPYLFPSVLHVPKSASTAAAGTNPTCTVGYRAVPITL